MFLRPLPLPEKLKQVLASPAGEDQICAAQGKTSGVGGIHNMAEETRNLGVKEQGILWSRSKVCLDSGKK